jgi:hypothetical protein
VSRWPQNVWSSFGRILKSASAAPATGEGRPRLAQCDGQGSDSCTQDKGIDSHIEADTE